MKKISIIALVLVLTASLAACRNGKPANTSEATTRATTMPTTQATQPTTHATQPSTHETQPSTHPNTEATTDATHGTENSEHSGETGAAGETQEDPDARSRTFHRY